MVEEAAVYCSTIHSEAEHVVACEETMKAFSEGNVISEVLTESIIMVRIGLDRQSAMGWS